MMYVAYTAAPIARVGGRPAPARRGRAGATDPRLENLPHRWCSPSAADEAGWATARRIARAAGLPTNVAVHWFAFSEWDTETSAATGKTIEGAPPLVLLRSGMSPRLLVETAVHELCHVALLPHEAGQTHAENERCASELTARAMAFHDPLLEALMPR